MNKFICKIFGHPNRPHYHRKTDIVACSSGCEKVEKVYEIESCPRCGFYQPPAGVCNHNYVYSHKEQELILGSIAHREIDVVICTKCGQVKRN